MVKNALPNRVPIMRLHQTRRGKKRTRIMVANQYSKPSASAGTEADAASIATRTSSKQSAWLIIDDSSQRYLYLQPASKSLNGHIPQTPMKLGCLICQNHPIMPS